MQKVDKEKAEKVLRMANEKPVYQDDTIGASIDSILRGSHKTYRYVLVTSLLAKSTNKDIDILSLQAKDDSAGAYDARSLCHKVIVAQWKFSGDKHKSLQVDTERTFHQRYPLAML